MSIVSESYILRVNLFLHLPMPACDAAETVLYQNLRVYSGLDAAKAVLAGNHAIGRAAL